MIATRPPVVAPDAFTMARQPKNHRASPSSGPTAIGAGLGVVLLIASSSGRPLAVSRYS